MTAFLTVWPPLAFALVLAGASVVAVRKGATSADAVGAFVQSRIPVLLALTLSIVGATLAVLLVRDAGIRADLTALGGRGLSGWVVGAVAGCAIAAVYFGGLDRLVQRAQARFGDVVPPGSTTVLGTGGGVFFLANVILAPLVEEVWYRGVLFEALSPLDPVVAAIIGCAAFGLFHWPGGAWYVLTTGVLVGGACWALRVWDGGLAAPYAAHLALNVIEYVVLSRRARAG